MTCQACQTSGIVASGLHICWCEKELCAACVVTHVETCTAYQEPSIERTGPIAFKGQKAPKLKVTSRNGFEQVMYVMKRMKRGR